MDIEGILAILLLFGGGTVIAVSFSPVGRAIAERIRGKSAQPETDPAVLDELEHLRGELTELQERVDFAERLLTRVRESQPLPGSE
ncbi:MAG TPA: hypothetical protein VMG41_11325 [Gemmatimonadales bacterium]|nr:hypothetical protein [Gemmatimonadales bacterium]